MNICIFGDSITWGAYDPINRGWASMLRAYFEDNYDETIVYNLGICGDDSMGLLRRLDHELKARQPEIIILAIGANDIKHQPDIPVNYELFEQNIKQIVAQSLKFTNHIIIVAITSVDEKLTTPRDKPPYNYRENKDVAELNKILQQTAEDNQLIFVPLPDNFTQSDLFDGLHPNSEGHQKLFNAIKPIAEKLVRLKLDA